LKNQRIKQILYLHIWLAEVDIQLFEKVIEKFVLFNTMTLDSLHHSPFGELLDNSDQKGFQTFGG